MPPTLALFFCAIFIIWLFAWDAKQRVGVSSALWIPLAWLFVISSRPVSVWMGSSSMVQAPDGALQDAFIDKAVFLLLIAAGLYVLSKRRVNWRKLFRVNRWLFIYFLYLALSVLWADDSFVSLKRWIKNAGNVVMVLVILSELDPVEAVRAFLVRFTYLLVPLSVLVIKFYPNISRRYDMWSYEPGFVGVTLGKNLLGMALFLCGPALLWLLLQLRDGEIRGKRKRRIAFLTYALLSLMTVWLLHKAQSSTALACSLVACAALLAFRLPVVRTEAKRLGLYAAGLFAAVILCQATGLWGVLVAEFAKALGRDPTLHGRAEIWAAVLKEDINPLTGAGFYSFWTVERNQRLSVNYYYSLGEAHNGYIELYLNSGLIGVALFALMIVAASKRIKREVVSGSSYGALRLAFLIPIGAYGLSESIFDRLNPPWFLLLLLIMNPPERLRRKAPVEQVSRGDAVEPVPIQRTVGGQFSRTDASI